jgi:hypothetical protein
MYLGVKSGSFDEINFDLCMAFDHRQNIWGYYSAKFEI